MGVEENILNGYDVEDENDLLGQISQSLYNTQEQCQMLQNLIKNQIEVKDSQIDKLYAELEYYKKDSAGKFVEQIMKSVIKVRKDIQRRIQSEQWKEMSADELRKEYVYILEDMTDLLEQQNIDSYVTSSGELFDASIHQAKIEITDVLELDKIVKCSLSEGYRNGNKVIIPERVIVYQHK